MRHSTLESPSALALTQFRRRVKKAFVFRQRITIGHTGDVVTDKPRTARFIMPLEFRRSFRPFLRHQCGIFEESEKKIANYGRRLDTNAANARVTIHVLEE